MLPSLTYLPRRLQGVLLSLGNGKSHLGVGFTLRCLQRLSVPHLATQLCIWRYNWCTSGGSIPCLLYTSGIPETALAQAQQHYTALKASPFVENSGIGFILFGSACDLALPLQQLCEVKMLLVNPLRRDYFPAMISVIEASEEESMFLQIKAKLENIV